jgi:hypothetical protein
MWLDDSLRLALVLSGLSVAGDFAMVGERVNEVLLLLDNLVDHLLRLNNGLLHVVVHLDGRLEGLVDLASYLVVVSK